MKTVPDPKMSAKRTGAKWNKTWTQTQTAAYTDKYVIESINSCVQ